MIYGDSESIGSRRFVTAGELIADEVPWGRNEWLSRLDVTGGDHLMLCRVHVPPGAGHAFHKHPELDEIIYVISGRVEQWVDQERRDLAPGEIAHIPMGVVHASFNAGNEMLTLLAILSPGRCSGEFVVDVSGEEPWASIRG